MNFVFVLRRLSHKTYHLSGRLNFKTILAAVWITEGVERCVVGRVYQDDIDIINLLDGRLVQVVEFFSDSRASNKTKFSTQNDGACLVALIDKYIAGDEALNAKNPVVESDSDNDSA